MAVSRNTRQKELIFKEINNINNFFNADEAYEKVNKKDNRIGIATVYRVLRNLREKNFLHHYTCNRKIIYSKDNKIHGHFTCQKCGNVIHINLKKLDFLRNNVKGEICHFQIDVEGVCGECLNRE